MRRIFFHPDWMVRVLSAVLVTPSATSLSCYRSRYSFFFARTPYLYNTKRFWPWLIAAMAGPLQFWFVYSVLRRDFYSEWFWLLPLTFALPAATGALYLVRKEDVDLASGDARLATQGAA